MALLPSATLSAGPLMDNSAVSSSSRVIVAAATLNPVSEPDTVIVSSPSTTASAVGVTFSVPEPDASPSGIFTLANDDAV